MNDLTKSLQSTAMLVDFHGGFWDAKRKDLMVVDAVKDANNAYGDVGVFYKNLLAGADAEYKNACKQVNMGRNDFYAKTLPWTTKSEGVQRGARMLPTRQFNDFIEDMAERRRKLEKYVADFCAVYDVRLAEGMSHLGDMGKLSDYPTVVEIKARFYIELDFEPVPSGDNFGGLPEGTLDHLTKHMAKSQQVQVDNAMADGYSRIRKVVGHMAETLADTSKDKFQSSLVNNVGDLAKQLAGFNVAGDPRMDEIAADMASLTTETIQTFKAKPEVRKAAASSAADVLAKLDAYGL